MPTSRAGKVVPEASAVPPVQAASNPRVGLLWDQVIAKDATCAELLPKLAEIGGLLDRTTPQWSWVGFRQAQCLLRSGSDADLLDAMAELLRPPGLDHAMLSSLGYEFWKAGKLDFAQALLEKALATGRDDHTLQFLSLIAGQRAMFSGPEQSHWRDQEIGYLREAVDLASSDHKGFMHMELAKRLDEAGRPDEVLKEGEQALQEARAAVGHGVSQSALAHMYVDFGRLLCQRGQREQGDRYMREGVGLTPNEEFRRRLVLTRRQVIGETLTAEENQFLSKGYTIPED